VLSVYTLICLLSMYLWPLNFYFLNSHMHTSIDSFGAGGVTYVVELLPSKCEALSSNSSAAQKKT
jgi:hypothetical protein